MRFLFIIQGEGRGHMTQAIALRNILVKHGHEIVEVMVGKSPTRTIPQFFIDKIQAPVTSFDSPNFLPDAKTNKISALKSTLYNLPKANQYFESAQLIKHKIKKTQPDRVVNFYDLVTGMAYSMFRPKVPMICIAHQYLLLNKSFPLPENKKKQIPGLLLYTKATCFGAKKILALSFDKFTNFDDDTYAIVPPLLRQEVLEAEPEEGDFILGYILNHFYETNIRAWHDNNKSHSLEFFWDKDTENTVTKVDETLCFHKLDDTKFIDKMRGCKAYATTGGFESICEALYLNKPVLMVPAHIEQECNAMDAMRVGAGVRSDDFNLTSLVDFIPHYNAKKNFKEWVLSAEEEFIKQLTEPL